MAAASVLIPIASEGRCAICQTLTRDCEDLRQLPCDHQFCFECLERNSEVNLQSENIVCTICSKQHPINRRGLSSLPKVKTRLQPELSCANVSRSEMDLANPLGDAQQYCSICEEDGEQSRAKVYCCDCHKLLCSNDLEIHRRWRKDHSKAVISVHKYLDKKAKFTKRTCTEHPRQEIVACCVQCPRGACTDCLLADQHDCIKGRELKGGFTVTSGGKHKYEGIAKVEERLSLKLNDLLGKVDEKREIFRLEQKRIAGLRENLDQEYVKHCDRLNQIMDDQVSTLRAHWAQLESELELCYRDQQEYIEKMDNGEFENTMDNMQSLMARVGRRLRSEHPQDLLVDEEKLCLELQSATELKLPLIEPMMPVLSVPEKCIRYVAKMELDNDCKDLAFLTGNTFITAEGSDIKIRDIATGTVQKTSCTGNEILQLQFYKEHIYVLMSDSQTKSSSINRFTTDLAKESQILINAENSVQNQRVSSFVVMAETVLCKRDGSTKIETFKLNTFKSDKQKEADVDSTIDLMRVTVFATAWSRLQYYSESSFLICITGGVRKYNKLCQHLWSWNYTADRMKRSSLVKDASKGMQGLSTASSGKPASDGLGSAVASSLFSSKSLFGCTPSGSTGSTSSRLSSASSGKLASDGLGLSAADAVFGYTTSASIPSRLSCGQDTNIFHKPATVDDAGRIWTMDSEDNITILSADGKTIGEPVPHKRVSKVIVRGSTLVTMESFRQSDVKASLEIHRLVNDVVMNTTA